MPPRLDPHTVSQRPLFTAFGPADPRWKSKIPTALETMVTITHCVADPSLSRPRCQVLGR
jgi:hypothetical protein